MKQQIKVWSARALALVVVVFAAQHYGLPLYKQYFTPKKKTTYIPTTKVRQGKFTISFHEIGTLDAETSVPVISEINGKIISLVDEGAVVKQGQTLAILDTTELEREIHTKTLTYQNAVADVDKAKAEYELLKESNKTDLAQSQAQLNFDKNELTLAREDLAKKEKLAEEKLIPGSQVDQAKGVVRSKELAVAKGEAGLKLKEKDVETKEQQKEADIRNVEFRADMAKNELDLVQSQLEKAVITAPAGGLVVMNRIWDGSGRRALQEGDSVRPQQTLCTLPDLSSILVKVQVGEADAPQVKLGMPITIRLDAVPGKVFHGTVKDISSLATESRPWEGGTPGKKNFEVTIAVKESNPEILKPGMTADCEFICDTIDDAVFIPIEAVVEKQGKTYVYVRESGKYQRVEVDTGKHNDNFICISKGLSAGQVVALRDPTEPLDLQEAGSSAPGVDKDKKKEAPPIPNGGNK